MDSNLNQLAPITDFDKAYILAQQALENGFRGTTFPELYTWLKGRLDLTGLSNTAGLPEDFPEPGSTLETTNPQGWTIIGPGTYNKILSGTISIASDEFGFAQFDGVDFNRILKIKMPKVLIENEILKDGNNASSTGAVYRYINGGSSIYGENKVLSSYVTNPVPTTTLATYIFDKVYNEETRIPDLTYYGVVEGLMLLCVFSRNGNQLSRSGFLEINIKLGENTLVSPKDQLIVPAGGMFGIAVGAAYVGRIGWLSSSTDADYYARVGASTPAFDLPASKVSSGGIGLKFTYEPTKVIGKRVDSIYEDMKALKGIEYTGGWMTQLNGLMADYLSNPDYVTLDFTTGSQSVKQVNVLPPGERVFVRFSAKVIEGGTAKMILGFFATINSEPASYEFELTEEEKSFEFELLGSNGDIGFGILAANNFGQKIAFRDFTVVGLNTVEGLAKRLDREEADLTMPDSFCLDNIFGSLSRYDKKVLVIKGGIDSLIRNNAGGPIPNLEPIHERPPGLGDGNTLLRRVYDLVSWNRPVWRRLNHPLAWTKTGLWTTVNNGTIWEGKDLTDVYHTTNAPGASASITVPAGYENFSLICRKGTDSGSIEIYVNNVLRETVDTLKPNAGHTGNPFHRVDIFELPAGQDNVIKIVNKSTNTKPIFVWGSGYWSGSTTMVFNVAHGGHTLNDYLTQHFEDEVMDQKPDAFILELPLMNEARVNDIPLALQSLKTMLDRLEGIELLTMSTNPMGLTQDRLTNWYTSHSPMEPINEALKAELWRRKKGYVGILESFKKTGYSLGFTLESGELGFKYTTDGQHQNPEGMLKWWNILLPIFKQMPIYLES